MEKNNIWLFGAGKNGKRYINELGKDNVYGFIDNDESKNGTEYCSLPVYGYKRFINENTNFGGAYIVITCALIDEIFIQLRNDNIPYNNIKVYVPQRGVCCYEDAWTRSIYSQLGEEIGLKHYFTINYPNDYKGVYVDIGAFHPYRGNNTMWAYKMGWRGINIDANEKSIELFNIFRPNDTNVVCGVSDRNEEMDYYVIEDGAENSFKPREIIKDKIKCSYKMKVRNINDILTEYSVGQIDFMDVDVEGFEERIIMAFDWKRFNPRCVLIEFLGMGSIEDVLKTEVHKKMREEGYYLKSYYTVTALYIKA